MAHPRCRLIDHRRRLRLPALAVLLGLLFGLPGCGPKAYDDPLGKMMDKGDAAERRLAAAEQAEREFPDDPERLNALKQLVVAFGHPDAMRIYAIDALIRHNETEAKAYLRTALPRMNSWPAMQHLLDTAVERDWVDFTPALVRNYARPAYVYRDHERPEIAALQALNPGQSIYDIAFAVLTDEPNADVRERAAAWALLNRLTADRAALLARLAEADVPDDPLVMDLRAAAADLHVTADSLETVTWLQMLRSPLYAGFWQRAERAVATLDEHQRRGLALRHLGLIVQMHESGDPALRRSRDELLDELTRFVDRQRHYLKSADYDGHNDDHPQRLAQWADELTWADLLVMHRLTRLMADRRVVAAWFAQADEDHDDASTEYGGLLEWDAAGELRPVRYKPMLRRHDRAYYAPKSLTLNGYAAFGHYHFHAQRHNNARYAGPGRGDLDRIADAHRYSAVVLTFIDENALNVDYYRRGDVVVDLGTIVRRD